jgi:hypothetical protein
MSGKGELVNYTRLFKKAPLSTHDKEELKAKIVEIIENCTESITIEAKFESTDK